MMRSAAYRIAILSSLAYAIATIALGIAVYWAAHSGLQQQFDDRIAAELHQLIAQYRREGLNELRGTIARREAAGVTGDLRYALYAPTGQRVIGNFNGVRPTPGLQTLAVMDADGEADPLRVLAANLDNGDRLVVAADWDDLEHNDRLILSLLALACMAVALIGCAGALLLGAYLRRRLSAISVAAEGIMAGDLEHRIVISPRGDEFDRLSAVLNAMLDRIGDLLDNLRQVSSEIAHDLRTPLTHLRNHLETMFHSKHDPVLIEGAIDQADELLALFAAILRLSEIESGRLNASFSPINVSELVEELGESYAPAVEDGGRTFACTADRGAVINGDRELIAQAIVNLLENAQTHTPLGTQVQLFLTVRGSQVRLTIADNGPGVPEEDRERITRRFARLEASRTRPGNGLGLSLVAAIARIHGAKLLIEDNWPGLAVTLEFAR